MNKKHDKFFKLIETMSIDDKIVLFNTWKEQLSAELIAHATKLDEDKEWYLQQNDQINKAK